MIHGSDGVLRHIGDATGNDVAVYVWEGKGGRGSVDMLGSIRQRVMVRRCEKTVDCIGWL